MSRSQIVRNLVLTMGVPAVAQAATASFTGLPVDGLAVQFFQSLTNVWMPLIALVALIALVINLFFGFFQVGPRVVGFVFGAAILAGGLPMVASLFGGGLVTAVVW